MKYSLKILYTFLLLSSCSNNLENENNISDPYPPNTVGINMPNSGGEQLITIGNSDPAWNLVSIREYNCRDSYESENKKPILSVDYDTRDINGSWFSFTHTDNPRQMRVKILKNEGLHRNIKCDVSYNENEPWHIWISQTESSIYTKNIHIPSSGKDTISWIYNEAKKWDKVTCDNTVLTPNSSGVINGTWFTIEHTDNQQQALFKIKPYQGYRRSVDCYFSYKNGEPWCISIIQWGDNSKFDQ